jgi:hypothetical protein
MHEALYSEVPRLTCPLATADILAKSINFSFEHLDLPFLRLRHESAKHLSHCTHSHVPARLSCP